MMKTAQRIAVMIPAATIPRVREHPVFVLVVAYPISTAFGLCQVPRFAAQTALGF